MTRYNNDLAPGDLALLPGDIPVLTCYGYHPKSPGGVERASGVSLLTGEPMEWAREQGSYLVIRLGTFAQLLVSGLGVGAWIAERRNR